MAISFVNAGAIVAATSTTDPTVPLPASMQADDIILIHVYVRSTTNTTVISGYTEIAQVDTANADHRWFWKRHSGSESDPTANRDASADCYARAYAFRGCITSGSPFDVVGTPADFSSSPMSVSGITTTVADTMVVLMDGYADNNLASATTTSTGLTWTDIYAESSTGADGSIHMGRAAKSATGDTGTITVTYNSSFTAGDQSGCLVVALKGPSATTVNVPSYGQGTAAAYTASPKVKANAGVAAATAAAYDATVDAVDALPVLIRQWQLVQLIAH